MNVMGIEKEGLMQKISKNIRQGIVELLNLLV
jgi:hypothetical protein